jgi:hypothetical protein
MYPCTNKVENELSSLPQSAAKASVLNHMVGPSAYLPCVCQDLFVGLEILSRELWN